MELGKRHSFFGREIMKFSSSTGLLLLIVVGTLEGSTIPHKRTARALNATFRTQFDGTIQSRNPCTNTEIERSSIRGSHEFYHHSKGSSWSDYTRKCANLISDFIQAISNLVSFKDRQSGTFDLNINTKLSHKTDGVCADTKHPICPTPTVIVQSADCEVIPVSNCDDLPRAHAKIKATEICSNEEEAPVKVDEEEEKCSVGSQISINDEPQVENDKLDLSYSLQETPEPCEEEIPESQPSQNINPPETKSQIEESKPDTVPAYDQYEATDQEPKLLTTYDDPSSQTQKQTDSVVPSSEPISTVTEEEKTDNQSENYGDEETPEEEEPVLEFSDQLAVYNVREPQESTSTQHYSSDTTTPSTFEIKIENLTDNDVQETPTNTQPTVPQSESYDEQTPFPQTVTFSPLQPQPDNYANDYDQVASDDLATPSPTKDEESLEFSDQLAVYNVRQPQPESPSSSSLLKEPTIEPSTVTQSQPDNYVNYEHEAPSNVSPPSPEEEEPSIEFSDQLAVYNVRTPSTASPPSSLAPSPSSESEPDNYVNYDEVLPTTLPPQEEEEPSIEFSDQLAVYNVRQPYFVPTSTQASLSAESQPDNYVNYDDGTISNQMPTTLSPLEEEEPSVEFSDQLAVYNVRQPYTESPSESYVTPTSVEPSPSSEAQPDYDDGIIANVLPTTLSPPEEEEPSIEFSDQLAVYNVRQPYFAPTSTQASLSAESQPDDYVNYEDVTVSNQIPATSPPPEEEEPSIEYSDQLAVYNVRQKLFGTTPSPIMNYDATTLPPSFPTYESEPEVEPTITPESEAESSNYLPVQSQPDSASVAGNYLDYNEQTVTNEPPLASSSGNVNPDLVTSVEYVDNTVPESGSSDYGSTNQDYPSDSVSPLPSSSGDLTSADNVELQFDPRSSTPLPSGAEIFSDQISGFREPESDSSLISAISDDSISDFVTTSYPLPEPESSNNYDDSSSLVDSKQNLPEISITVEESTSSSSDQLSPNNYENYDDQPSVFESSANETTTTTDEQILTNVFTTLSPSIPDNSDIYDDSTPLAEPEGTYPPITDKESVNYEDKDASTSVSDNKEDPTEEQQDDDDDDDDQGPLHLSPNTFRPNAQIETTVNYADETPFRPIRLPPTVGPLPENNIVYDQGIFRNETEPSAQTGEEAADDDDDSLIVSSEVTKETVQQFDSSTSLAPESDTYETLKQSSSSSTDEPLINMTYDDDDDVQPLRNPSANLSVDYSSQDITTAPSISETYTDYNTFDHQIEPTSSPTPEDQESIEFSDELAVYNIRTPITTTLSPLNDMATTPAPSLPSVEFDTYDSQYVDTEPQPTLLERPIQTQSSEDLKVDMNYPDETVSNQLPTSPSPPDEEEPSVEFSDQLAVYNIRQPYFGPTSTQPSPSVETQPDNYVNYEDEVVLQQSQPTTLPPVEQEEPSIEFSDQLAVYNVRQSYPSSTTQSTLPSESYVEPIAPSPSSESQPDNYVNYEDEVVSSQLPASPSPPKQEEEEEEPSLEYSDQLAVYNVRQPYLVPTSTQPSPSSENQQDNYFNYDDSIIANQPPTTLSPPEGEEPSIEFSDQLAVYNVREPQGASTTFPPLTQDYDSYVTTASLEDIRSENVTDYDVQESPMIIQPTVPPAQYDSYDERTPFTPTFTPPQSQPDNYANYEDQTASNESASSPPPTLDVEPSLEYSDELAIYNVRSPYSPTSSPSPPLDDEDVPSTSFPTFMPSPAYDEQISVQPSSSEAQPDSYVNYEDQEVSNEFTATYSPSQEQPSIEFSDQLAVYNVRQPYPTSTIQSPLASESYVETVPTVPSSESQPDDYVNYDDGIVANQTPTTLPPSNEEEPSIEFSDQLAVYNVRQPFTESPVGYVEPTSTKPSLPSESQPEGYVNYEDDILSNQSSTSSAQEVEEPSIEYSDQLAVYNVRQALPSSTTQAPLPSESYDEPIPIQSSSSSEVQPDNYVNYEDSTGVQESSTSSPQVEEPSIEYSDQLAVYNVRQPFFQPTSTQPSLIPESQPETYVNYEDEMVPQEPTTLPPPKGEEPSIEFSDQLAVYNVRQPSFVPTSTQTSPSFESVPEEDYDDEVEQESSTLSSSQDAKPSIEFSDQLAVYNVRQPFTESPVSYVEPNSTQPSPEAQLDSHVNYEDEVVSNQTPTTSSPQVEESEPSIEYSDQLAIYNIRQPVSSSPSPLSDNFSSDMVTTPAPSLPSAEFDTYDSEVVYPDSQSSFPPEGKSQFYNEPTSIPVSVSPESRPDNYVNYEDPMVTVSPLVTDDPSIEFSDQLAVYNVRVPYSSSTTQTPLPSESYDEPSFNASSPSPPVEGEQFLEYSDQLSIYNVRQPSTPPSPSVTEDVLSGSKFPSTMPETFNTYDDSVVSDYVSTPSSDLIPKTPVTYDEYPMPKEETSSMPATLSLAHDYSAPPSNYSVDESVHSQPTNSSDYDNYDYTMTTQPSSHQSQDNYANYEDSKEITTSSVPPRVEEPSIEYSDQLAVYNVRQPSFVPTSTQTSLPSESQPDEEDYEDEQESSTLPSPQEAQPSIEFSDQLAVYNVRQPFFPTSTQPSLTPESQSDNYVNYEDEKVPQESTTSPSPKGEEPSIEFSDQLAVYNVRQPSFVPTSTQTSPSSESVPEEDYDDEVEQESSTLPSPQDAQPSIEFSDQLAVYNVRQPLTESPVSYVEPIATQPVPSSQSQTDNYVNYEDEVVSNQPPTTSAPQVEVEPSIEYSDQLAVYNVRQPFFPTTSTQSPLLSESQQDEEEEDSEDEIPEQESSALPSPQDAQPSIEFSDQLAVYNVRQPFSSSPSPLSENFSNDVMTTPAPSLSSEGLGSYDTQVVYTDSQPTFAPESDSDMYNEPTSVPAAPSPDSEPNDYENDDDESELNDLSTASPPSQDVQPSIEYSDQLAVYNVRSPYPQPSSPSPPLVESIPKDSLSTFMPSPVYDEPTPVQPSSSQSEPDNYVNYSDETVSNEPITSPSPTKEEPSVEFSDQLAVYNIRQPYFVPTSTQPSPSVENQQDNYPNYEDEVVSKQSQPTTLPPAELEEPSMEFSDQLAVYNVRQPFFTSTTPSPFEPSSVQPSSPESQTDEDDYEDDVVESTSTPSPGEEPSVEYSDQLAVYNVREPLFGTTPPPVVTTSIPHDSLDTYVNQQVEVEFQPTSAPEREPPIYDEPTLPSSSETQPGSYVSYEDEVVSNGFPTSTSPPQVVEPFVEYSDQLAVYNVRQPFSSSPSPLSKNFSNDMMTTPAPSLPSQGFVTYDTQVEDTNVQPTFAPQTDYKLYDDSQMNKEPTSIGPLTSSEQQPDQYVNYEDEKTSNEMPTPPPQHEVQPSLEFSEQLAVYNVRQPSFVPTSTQTSISSESQPDEDDYEDEVEQESSTLPSPQEAQPSIEFSDQLAVYNVRQPFLQPTSTQPSLTLESQPDNYVNYEDETLPQESTTSPSPKGEEPSIEFSDQLAVYNVRQPSFVPTSTQTSLSSESQPEEEDYEDEVEQESSTLPSPQDAQPSIEYSDQLAVYNVRQPFTESPVSSVEPSSTQPVPSSQSQTDNYVNYEDEVVSNQPPTTSAPQVEVEPSIEYSDQLAVYNVRQPFVSSTTQPPLPSESFVEPSPVQTSSPKSQPEDYVNYEDAIISNQTPTTLPPQSEVEPSIEFSDQLAVYNVRQPSVEPTTVQPLPSTDSDTEEDYEDEVVANGSSTPPPRPPQDVPAFVEYSDQLAVYNVRQPFFQPTSTQPSLTPESQPDNYVNYEDETVPHESTTTPSPLASVEPSIEFSDQLAVYNVREPLSETTPSPFVSTNVPSTVTTLPPLSSEPAVVEPSSESQPDNYDDYEDETVSTIPPLRDDQPSVELSDQLSIYNVRQRPPQYSTPSPFNDNILNSIVTTISPFFASKDSFPTTLAPEYESDEQEPSTEVPSSPEPQPDNYVNYEDENVSEQTTPKVLSPETLSNYDEQTIPNEIQSEQSPDLSTQLNSESRLESQTPSFTTTKPDMEESLMEPTSSPMEEPSIEYSDQLAIYNVREPLPEALATSTPAFSRDIVTAPPTLEVITETYTDYEDQKTNFDSQPTVPPQTDLLQYDEPSRSRQTPTTSQPHLVNYDYYDNQNKTEESSTALPSPQAEESIEYSDQLAVYNVRQPYLEPSSTQSSPSHESQPDNYVNYEDETVVYEFTTPSTPQKELEPSIEFSDQLAVYNVRQPESSSPSPLSDSFSSDMVTTAAPSLTPEFNTYDSQVVYADSQQTFAPESVSHMYDEPTAPLTSSSETKPDNYVNYDDQIEPSELPTPTSPPASEEPSVEYSDQLAVYNVRQPFFPTSTQPSLKPESQPDNYVTYEDETVPQESTTLASPKGEEPSIEFSDQLAVYNVRQPSFVPTSTQTSPSSESQPEEEDYEDEVEQESSTLPSPQDFVQPSIEFSDQLAVYNVRQPFTESPVSYVEPNSTQPSPEAQLDSHVNYEDEVVSNQPPTTASPQVEVEPSIEYSDQLAVYNVRQPFSQPTSTQPSLTPESQPDNYVNYEDETIAHESTTLASPKVEEPSVEFSDQLAVYNVRQPSFVPTSTQTSPSSQSQPDEEDYEDEEIVEQTTPEIPSVGEEPSLEYSDQLAVYNVRQPMPPSTTQAPLPSESYDEPIPIQSSSSSEVQPDNYVNYEDNTGVKESSTSSSPPVEEPSIEYSDQLAVYNVRQPFFQPTSTQPSLTPESQPETYVNYEDEMVPQEPTTLPPPKGEEPSIEFSDQLAVYNVRQPSFVPTSTQTSPSSESQPEEEDYEDEIEQESSTLPSPQDAQPSIEYSDQLAVYNVREQFPEPTLSSVVTDTTPGVVSTLPTPSSSLDKAAFVQPSSESQPDNYDDYEDETVSTIPPLRDDQPSVEFSDQLSIYNVRQRPPQYTTPSPSNDNILSSIMTTLSPFFTSKDSSLSESQDTISQSTVIPDVVPQVHDQPSLSEPHADEYVNYEDEVVSTQSPTSLSPQMEVQPSIEFSDQLAVYNVRQPFTEPPVEPSVTEPTPSSQSQSDNYANYEDEVVSTSPHLEDQPSIEYSDQLAVYNVREPVSETTPSPVVSENIPSDIVTTTYDNQPVEIDSAHYDQVYDETMTTRPSSPKSQPDNYVDYEDHKEEESPIFTTLPPLQTVEPSIEYSDQLAVYNVRQPYSSSPSPLVDNDMVTTAAPSPSPAEFGTYDTQVTYTDSQPTFPPESDSQVHEEPSATQLDNYVNYEDEIVLNQTPTTTSPQVEVEPSIEYSDQLAVYNVRQPFFPTSTQPSLTPGSQPDNYVNYEDETVPQESTTSPSPKGEEPSIEFSDQLAVYNVRQPSFVPTSTQTSPSSESQPDEEDYEDEIEQESSTLPSPQDFIQPSIEYSDQLAIYNVRQPQLEPSTLSPDVSTGSDKVITSLPQNPVEPSQDDFYTYDDQSGSDSQTTSSPEIETEYDETTDEPETPPTEPLLEPTFTTLRPRPDSEIDKKQNKTMILPKKTEPSTLPPLQSYLPLNQPSYPPPGEDKQQVLNGPLVPPSDSYKESSYFSNLVNSQDTRPIDGISLTQRQPDSFALVPDQTNPSNEPGEDYVSCTCKRGDGRPTHSPLLCPFNPVLKGNMTAPSYYILVTKLSGASDTQSQPEEERFQVEKVYLGDGTPLNCTNQQKTFPTSLYTPIPISSARTVKIPTRLNNA